MDSPCMMETLKTVDQKTFYKIADVMQVSFFSSFKKFNVKINENI